MAPRLLNCRDVGAIIRKLSFDRGETLGGRTPNVGAAEAPREYAGLKAA